MVLDSNDVAAIFCEVRYPRNTAMSVQYRSKWSRAAVQNVVIIGRQCMRVSICFFTCVLGAFHATKPLLYKSSFQLQATEVIAFALFPPHVTRTAIFRVCCGPSLSLTQLIIKVSLH